MVVAVTVGVGKDNEGGDSEEIGDGGDSNTAKAITAICQPADYKQSCEQSLEKSAGNATDPKEIVMVAFTIAQKSINEAMKKSDTLKELDGDPRTHEALVTCKELMNMSISELEDCLAKVENFDFNRIDDFMADLTTWLSAAMTYQETCLDGFVNVSSVAGAKMKDFMNKSMELTTNGLDIVTGLNSLFSSFQPDQAGPGRRLLNADGSVMTLPVLGHGNHPFPNWVPDRFRRLLEDSDDDISPDVVVAEDGSGDSKSINEGLKLLEKAKKKKKEDEVVVLYVKAGTYKEYVEVTKNLDNMAMIGDGADKTVITGDKNFIDGVSTYHTSTVAITADFFFAKNIRIVNSAGPEKHQAVALRVSADFAIFYNCTFDGYQDTLYTHTKRQFYRDCTISGTIDYIFGDAAVVFQNCLFLVRKPMENQQCIVTAQGRKQRHQPTAIIIQNGTITAAPEMEADRMKYKTYLGRPWKNFSRTIIMESYLGDLIDPEGWMPWMGTVGTKTCWYGEFGNYGPGADQSKRVTWNGIKKITPQHAVDFTPGRFLRANEWVKPTGIPYVPYMVKPSTTRRVDEEVVFE
ncbi:unnamed protein product [Linum tenue]|uniref:Pectinesterase n=2 Tax=Linum tenue TaxID=586396 RepID=A0AAV0NNF4_9ROSI|nr:unnamed protein product [Linum tenue]